MIHVRSLADAVLLVSAGIALADGRRPNVVVILADDQGWGDLSVNGNTNLSTPPVDSLARDGARFDRFFVHPVCSPTRAEFLTGRATELPDRALFPHWTGRVSARTQRYRLDAAGKLYDLVADPGQARDVTAAHPAEARRLADEVARWKQDVLSELGDEDDRPDPVGYPAPPVAPLPARDGVPHGGVRRGASAPNCSFLTHWTTPDDRMTWDVLTLRATKVPGRQVADVRAVVLTLQK